MDRYLLRYFLAVAELGSFSKAAQRVSVTQPTLSVGIAKLEQEVGARLFERTIQAARDLYGVSGAVERAVTQAWTAVGVN